jgi:hypothetical protein
MGLGLAAAWLALTLKDWFEFTSKWQIQCVVLGGILVVSSGVSLSLALTAKEGKVEVSNSGGLSSTSAGPESKEKQDTKQSIRSFLESLRPDILAKVDARAKQIGVWLGSVSQTKLTMLSERPGFDTFLSFKSTANIWMTVGEAQMGDFIKPPGENGTLTGYYLYPKDALLK